MNTNSDLDPQNESHRLAHVDPREQQPTGPNVDDLAYDGWGGCYPGDGSGMDDLADWGAQESFEDAHAEMDDYYGCDDDGYDACGDDY